MIHETAKDALAAWDRGEIVHSVEMGGIGPGYEQAIQILVSPGVGGFSGAQVGAATGLARHAIEKGWAKTLGEVGSDRRIMVCRKAPTAPPAPEVTP